MGHREIELAADSLQQAAIGKLKGEVVKTV